VNKVQDRGETNNVTVRRIIDCNRGTQTQNKSSYLTINARYFVWYSKNIINLVLKTMDVQCRKSVIRHITENMKCVAENNYKNRKCSSLYSNTVLLSVHRQYPGQLNVTDVNLDVFKKNLSNEKFTWSSIYSIYNNTVLLTL